LARFFLSPGVVLEVVEGNGESPKPLRTFMGRKVYFFAVGQLVYSSAKGFLRKSFLVD
jgi:hypothetical protein